MIRATPFRHLVLVGLMGTGKTTTCRILSARLGVPVFDSDAEIEAAEGRTVRELRDELGTGAMHDVEARALLRALDRPGPDVVGAAASTIDREDCREALREEGVAVVWLSATPAVAAARFRGDDHRPRYGDDIETFLAAQAREREPRFRSVDPVEVATDVRTPDEVADAVIEALAQHVNG